jgi:L-asparaginase
MIDQGKKIHFILTGGTIDSKWLGKADTTVPHEHSVIPEYLKNLELYLDLEFSEVCMKDSRDLTPEDTQKILQTVEHSPAEKVIITHGTYTMPDTARFLKANLKRKGQTVVLTGSMSPLKGFDASDAAFALGYAIAQVGYLPSGIYLAMNGKIFTADEVAKDLSKGKFYSIFQSKQ